MICPQCHKEFDEKAAVCPHCGARNRTTSGVFQTTTVLISADGAEHVYRSVEEVPTRLRNRLLKTTNGANSATILIADRKGRKEIDKAMRKLPGPVQRRLVHSALSGESGADPLGWLTPAVRKWLAIVVAMLAVLVTVAVFMYRGTRG